MIRKPFRVVREVGMNPPGGLRKLRQLTFGMDSEPLTAHRTISIFWLEHPTSGTSMYAMVTGSHRQGRQTGL